MVCSSQESSLQQTLSSRSIVAIVALFNSVYFAGWTEFTVEFVDGRGDAFVFFSTGQPEEIIVCGLVEVFARNKMANFGQMKALHSMFNDEKVKESSATAKFLIKTIKPRG